MKDLKDILKENLEINEKLIINKNIKVNKYHYHPKDRKEFKKLVEKLVKERGLDADLNDIDTSEITDMSYLFNQPIINQTGYDLYKFNGDISEWDVSKVTDMKFMFNGSFFNGDISKWDVSNVTDMYKMFNNSKFTGENGNISEWDVSKVTDMESMFEKCPLEKNPPKWYK